MGLLYSVAFHNSIYITKTNRRKGGWQGKNNINQLETFVPWTLVKRGLRKQIITPLDAPQEFMEEVRRERQARESAQDTALLRALGLAYTGHRWLAMLESGEVRNLSEIGAREKIDNSYVSRMVNLTSLAPTAMSVGWST